MSDNKSVVVTVTKVYDDKGKLVSRNETTIAKKKKNTPRYYTCSSGSSYYVRATPAPTSGQ